MSKERELLKEVLKVLDWNGIMGSHDTYNSIKELLAQTEQEPVVWQVIGIAGFMYVYNKPIDQVYEHHTVNALYLAPPKRKPLSEEAVCEIFPTIVGEVFVDLVRIIEKAHGIGVDDE